MWIFRWIVQWVRDYHVVIVWLALVTVMLMLAVAYFDYTT